MITAVNLIALLGSAHVAPEVQGALAELGIDPKKVRIKRGDFDVSVECKHIELAIEFADPEKYKISAFEPEGALVLGHVMIFSSAVDALGGLPQALGPKTTRDQAKQLLGEPFWTSPVAPVDRWRVGSLDLTVRFDRNTSLPERFTYSLPK